ncbi:Imm15 family immunity protein [Planobispora takensis]|nr:Imm15 family immunity protein [Planobispora takensis]
MELLVTIDLDPRFKTELVRLIRDEGLDQFGELMEADPFEEVPLYSRYAQLEFLDTLCVSEKNRVLIRAAVAHMVKVVEYSRDYYEDRSCDYLCMVSVVGWEDSDGRSELLIPNLWIGNMRDDRLRSMRLHPAQSRRSEFVADALDGDAGLTLSEGLSHFLGESYVDRVYVRLKSMSVPWDQ